MFQKRIKTAMTGFILLVGCFFALVSTPVTAAESGKTTRVLVLGDSLTAGYGLGKEFAFPSILQEKADAAGLKVQIINAGVSGDTTAGGVRRVNWMLRQPVDILVLALGANDGLRGLSVDSSLANLQTIIDQTKAKNPKVRLLIAGMKVPPNMGDDYSRKFEAMFVTLAENNEAERIPFLLEGVGGRPELNLEDGIHPTKEGHRILADNVWRFLAPMLGVGT
ncbi:arylesterase [Acanthopleuribacter pedis]|uniref:Arylesterase n=1 Tax=Acanthopleuribacter pedis TaxID=442870 RepID=A0A8J7U778_9BACT|nr:arylesterase [Acanthopleuribacter pedis]MBO1322213.1 arylesterase [Acanthopleuribacter pedis]